VYQEILSIIADPDYGDITDLKSGRDIVVEFKSAEETGKSFPETSIRVKPNQTIAFDPTDKALLEKVKNQKNVTELFPELTYEELATVMDTWLNASADGAEPSVNEDVPAVTTEEPVASVTQQKAAVKAPSTAKAIAAEFDELFNT